MQTKSVSENVDAIAPDGSEIRLLVLAQNGSCVHCKLPPGAVTLAVRHRTVEEIWYVTKGRGTLWRKLEEEETETDLVPAVSVTIPLGAHFQFRAAETEPLEFILVTMPPWPGSGEAVRVQDHWRPTV